jgi:hypothetical protein
LIPSSTLKRHLLWCNWVTPKILRYALIVVNGKIQRSRLGFEGERNHSYMQEKLGTARGIGLAIAIAVAIIIALWRLLPHAH